MDTLQRRLKESKLGSTVLLKCSCSNGFQDSRYGQGVRVHNVGKRGESKKARCTVCLEEKT